jgi:hypothetical protein
LFAACGIEARFAHEKRRASLVGSSCVRQNCFQQEPPSMNLTAAAPDAPLVPVHPGHCAAQIQKVARTGHAQQALEH